jgi:hypothetical protein
MKALKGVEPVRIEGREYVLVLLTPEEWLQVFRDILNALGITLI